MLTLTCDCKTPYHKWPVWIKISCLTLAVIGIYASPIALIGVAVTTGIVYLIGGIQFARIGLISLKPLTFFIIVIVIWQLIIKDPQGAVLLTIRLVTAVGLANWVTLTTRLDDLLDFLMHLSKPLQYLGISAKPLALAVAMVVRFVPVFLERGHGLQQAWRARSIQKPNFRLTVPLVISVLDDADHVADALRARGGLAGASYKNDSIRITQ